MLTVSTQIFDATMEKPSYVPIEQHTFTSFSSLVIQLSSNDVVTKSTLSETPPSPFILCIKRNQIYRLQLERLSKRFSITKELGLKYQCFE